MCQISPRCSGCRSVAYDALGRPLTNGVFSYAYDASSRLASVSSNGVLLASFAYDAQGRRVRKVSHRETRSHTYFYDGWAPVRETLTTNNYRLTTDYVWGKDLSGSMQGAGGVGGLLYVSIPNSFTPNSSTHQLYIPLYDANGNITHYCDASGNVVASYTYDAFGNTISANGPMVDTFPHRFSTKYYDTESGLYYYGYRFYSPELMRWLNRDPIEEDGGINLYTFCRNNPIVLFDSLGWKCKLLSGPRIKKNATWELEKIKFMSISDSGHTLVYGIFGYWRILGEVDCLCSSFWKRKQCKITRDVYKTKYPQNKSDYSPIYPNTPELFVDIPNPAALPLEIPFFTSIGEGLTEIFKSKLLEILQTTIAYEGAALLTPALRDIVSAIASDMPSSNDGTWPERPCD